MPRDVTTLNMPHKHLQWVEFKKGRVSSRLSLAEQSYKCDFDKNVQPELTFKVGEDVFVDRPQVLAIASNAADDMGIADEIIYYVEGVDRTEYSASNCKQ